MVSPLLRSSLREIRQSLGRYVAILAIVALGVGFFSGLRMAEPNMKVTGADHVETYRLHDLRLLSTLGFTREDVAYFDGLDDVSAARGAVYTTFLWQNGQEDTVLMAHSLTKDVNVPNLLSGRMPVAADECLGDGKYFTAEDIGTTISLSPHNDDDTRELLRHDGYTIVGIADSPLYLNYERGTASIGNGSVAAFVLIPESGFDSEAYHEIFVHLDGTDAPYSAVYDVYMDSIQPHWENMTQTRADERYDTLYSDAMEELSEGEADLAEGWEEYYDGLEEWEDGKRDYADGLKEYKDGLKELEDGEAQLAAGGAAYQAGKQKAEEELEKGQEQLDALKLTCDQAAADAKTAAEAAGTTSDAIKAAYANDFATLLPPYAALVEKQTVLKEVTDAGGTPTQEQLDAAALAQTDYENAIKALIPTHPELVAPTTGLLKINALNKVVHELYMANVYQQATAQFEAAKADAEAQLASGAAQLAAGARELEEGRRKLEDAKQELADAARDIAEAEEELADGYQELLDGEAELAEGYEELSDLKEPDIFVLTRKENASYAGFDNDTNIVKAIAAVFPAFFYLVAALVCMTTMKRMVDEQRTQIGVLKALGYSNGQILGKYVLYSGSAAVVGSILGYALGSTLLPWVIWELYGMMYGFAELTYTFDWKLALLSFAAAMVSSVGVTIYACGAELRHQSAELLRPKAPKAGKRVFLEYITPLWRALSFLQKVSIRNVLRYRSRLVMILLGIGGCTALLITGFGIQDSVADIGNIQYEDITLYDYNVSFREAKTSAQAESYLTERGWAASDGLLLYTGSAEVIAPTGVKDATLTVSSTGSVENFVSLHDRQGPVAYPDHGEVVLTAGLAESLELTVGDTVQLRDDGLHTAALRVSGICDNYLGYSAYVTARTYEDMTGAAPAYKTLYVNATPGADVYAESVKLADKDEVTSLQLSAAGRTSMNEMLSRMSYIVVVVVVFAAALAFVVLYNLTNINISERIREIATIKVLGFTRGETASYIFREIYMLSVLGSIVGIGLGKALHAYVMAQVKVDGVYFPCLVSWPSYAISVALTLLFTAAICLFLRRKLNTVHMAESLKSIE